MKFIHLLRILVILFALACTSSAAEPVIAEGNKQLPLPGEAFTFDGHQAFVILPEQADGDTPWVWYAPTLPRLPGGAEVWMFKQFLEKGIAIAGIDVGESYGSPTGRALYSRFHQYLVEQRTFRSKPCLLARSRGGLMLYSWATMNPQSVAGVAGIYPVCSIASYPGLKRACGAYGLSEGELRKNLAQHNPIDRLKALAEAKVPLLHIHGDSDKVVPLEANSAELAKRYQAFGGPAEIMVIEGQGHNMWQGWFTSQRLTDFVIARALGRPAAPAAALPKPVAHWKLDDQDAVARDAVGNNHGRIVGAKPAAGVSGGCLEFVRKEGQHVVVPYSAELALNTFTVSAWVRLTREPTFSGIVGTRFGGDQTFDMKVNDAKVHGDIGNGKSWIETAVNFYAGDTGSNGQGGDLALDRWYHIVYVIDTPRQECRLYLDADLKKRIAFNGTPVLMSPANSLHIGHSSSTEFMDGLIDEVQIWGTALTSGQVKSLWSAEQP